jgi:hypothetical protein
MLTGLCPMTSRRDTKIIGPPAATENRAASPYAKVVHVEFRLAGQLSATLHRGTIDLPVMENDRTRDIEAAEKRGDFLVIPYRRLGGCTRAAED